MRHGSKHNLTREEWQIAPHAYVKRGLELPQTKLTPLDIAAIRSAVAERDHLRREITERLSNKALAAKFGVHQRTIEKVLSMETHFSI